MDLVGDVATHQWTAIHIPDYGLQTSMGYEATDMGELKSPGFERVTKVFSKKIIGNQSLPQTSTHFTQTSTE